jgi:D-aminopeptidase
MRKAVTGAKRGSVDEGCVGAGTGTVAFGWKGGIGTSSRVLPEALGGYTLGVLVQTNFGGVLTVLGAQVGLQLGHHPFSEALRGGSIMIILATDTPLSDRNLKRLARRGLAGLARTGAAFSNGSGDYALAFSTHPEVKRTPERRSKPSPLLTLPNDLVSPLFGVAIEATEEAIYNSLFMAETTVGYRGTVEALPVERVLEILRKPVI